MQFYIPLWIAICFNAYVFYSVARVLSSSLSATDAQDDMAVATRLVIRKLRFYPLILIIVRPLLAVWFRESWCDPFVQCSDWCVPRLVCFALG